MCEKSQTVDELITIGEGGHLIAEGAKDAFGLKITEFDNKEEATEYISGILRPGDVISLKASNGMHLSEIVEKIK